MIGDVPEPQPWSRVDDPTPIPSPATGDTVAELDPASFRRLIRDNLIPRDTSSAARTRWKALWAALGSPPLRHRTLDVLDEFLDLVEAHLGIDPQDRRAQQFQHRCGDAWSRLTKPASDKAPYGELAAAVRRHRADILSGGGEPRPADTALWKHLRRSR